ncbi:DUF5681 domain-containing protein [Qipengyuania oceanensis]|uniref:DUF5681 domain-containing protein n=1 Tax=Qipengyuania oceanensis TaxID=1463597 RepID=A0A844YMD1_9SPHN|nr:DUF5681 domain-containing protein [Qipengyuania oceanensis]MXO64074.1 hypothetical protein [Qipengyuania oceanensis]
MTSTRFQPGQSGNPKGRPKARRPNNSAFDIIIDQTLAVTQGDKTRDLTVDEALQLQTYQDALKGNRMAIRKVMKMIEKREAALAKKSRPAPRHIPIESHHCAENANEAMRILDIARPDLNHPMRWKVQAWATQAALSRPGRRKFAPRDVESIRFFTFDADTLRWPRGRIE